MSFAKSMPAKKGRTADMRLSRKELAAFNRELAAQKATKSGLIREWRVDERHFYKVLEGVRSSQRLVALIRAYIAESRAQRQGEAA